MTVRHYLNIIQHFVPGFVDEGIMKRKIILYMAPKSEMPVVFFFFFFAIQKKLNIEDYIKLS